MAKTAAILVRCEPAFKERLEKHLAKIGLSQTEFVQRLIEVELDEESIARTAGRPTAYARVAALEQRMDELEARIPA